MFLNRIQIHTLQKTGIFRNYFTKLPKANQTIGNNSQTINAKCYGQPSCHTHPHLVAPGEITPLITIQEYQDRRRKVAEKILAKISLSNRKKRQLIVIPSSSKQYMSDKIPYIFRQNTEFLYLSGCQEPDSCLVLTLDPTLDSVVSEVEPSHYKATLFVQEKDSHSEIWDGPRTGPDEARTFFGVDEGLPMSDLGAFIKSFHGDGKNPPVLWYDFLSPIQKPVHKVMDEYLKEATTKLSTSPKPFVQDVRKIKSTAEIQLMQKSCDIASDAIVKCMEASRPGIGEHELFATVDYQCRINGAEMLAYPPVVAGGTRATIIHYINNNQLVNNGEMVLMDAGCEYHGYSSDITRTWPVNGKFSPQQLDVYEAVLSVQSDIIDMCELRPPLDRLFDAMCSLLGKRLQEIGLIANCADMEQLYKTAYQFCPHHVSHYLGMDVHDTPTLAKNIDLVPGMIITVEPGIYINHMLKVRPEFKGIGIRIEDDILITEDGPVVLSRNCPKLPFEIEEIINKNSS